MGNSTAAAAGPPPSRFKVYTPGERPNENRGPEMIAATASLTALALIVVTLRVYVKLRFNTGLAIDDYLMVLAVVRCNIFRALLERVLRAPDIEHLAN